MTDPANESNSKQIVAQGDKDSLRSFFHLLVGKPDSTMKVLSRSVHVTPQSISDLHERVCEKLKTHHINGLVASADVSFEDKTTMEFGGWAEFESFRWTTSKQTREVRLRWHFLLDVQGYELPQQHALTVKLSGDARPIELLQAMLSKNPGEDVDEFELAPTICRVDFISNSIGQELIAVVEEWNESLPKPESRSDFISKLDNHGDKIAAVVDYSTPVLFAIAALFVLINLYPASMHGNQITVGVGVDLMRWLMCAFIAIYIGAKISHILARNAYHALDKYGHYCMFQMTNGDDNRRIEAEKINKKHFRKFVITSTASFLLNVTAGIVVAVFWPGA